MKSMGGWSLQLIIAIHDEDKGMSLCVSPS
jgi:hypothetical protein